MDKPHTFSHTARHTAPKKLGVYSNRPPVGGLEGGAVRVIGASKPDVWLGPASPSIDDEQWGKMSKQEQCQLSSQEVDGITVYTFPVPKSLQRSHYTEFANGIIWPVMHSMDPKTYFNPGTQTQDEHYTFLQSPDYLEQAYEGYQMFNELANQALQQLRDTGKISSNDTIWVHDYQCINVEGDVFSRHIPFPPLSYLEKVRISNTPLLETGFFNDYIRCYAQKPLISFQRPVDMQNFIETLARLDEHFIDNNPELVDDKGRLLKAIPLGKASLSRICAFGNRFSVLNVAVGISQQENLEEALLNEKRMDITDLNPDRLALSGIEVDLPNSTVPHSIDADEDEPIRLHAVLGSALEKGHRMFVSIGRNDYTKNTLEKLDAAEAFLKNHPEEVGQTHFVFVASPTRSGVKGYQEYEAQVLKRTRDLREQFGDSICVIPQAINHGDVMSLFRHPNTIGAIGVGLKDGHDLTVREAVDARADGKVPPVAVLLTDGTGASDILRGDAEKPGAYVIETSALDKAEQTAYLTEKLSEFIADIVEKSKSPEGRDNLQARYEVMKEASKIHSAKHYGETILNAAESQKKLSAASAGRAIG